MWICPAGWVTQDQVRSSEMKSQSSLRICLLSHAATVQQRPPKPCGSYRGSNISTVMLNFAFPKLLFLKKDVVWLLVLKKQSTNNAYWILLRCLGFPRGIDTRISPPKVLQKCHRIFCLANLSQVPFWGLDSLLR